MPHLHSAGQSQERKDQRQDHGCDLGADNDSLAVVTIGYDATQRGYQEYGKLAGESN